MSADVLRAAGRRIRHDVEWGQAHGDDAFLLAVARWLGACADSCPPPEFKQPTLALAVARAYLGEQP